MPERARRRRVAHDRLVLIGLAPQEVSLARTAAAGAYEIVVAHDEWPDGSRQDAVYVTSLAWWERVRARSPADGTLHAQRCVLLVPAEPAPASRWRFADALPLAIPVFTHTLEPELLLARAILVVRHGTVADALRARLARASAAPDLPTRALDAVLALLPDERTVPRLARAASQRADAAPASARGARRSHAPGGAALGAAAARRLGADGHGRSVRWGGPSPRGIRRRQPAAHAAHFDGADATRARREGPGSRRPHAGVLAGTDGRPAAPPPRRPAAPPPRRPAAPPDDA